MPQAYCVSCQLVELASNWVEFATNDGYGPVALPERNAVAAMPAHAIKQMPSVLPSLEQDSLSAVRPVRLFERPELIEAVAQVPDGPPISFRWRHIRHQIAHAEGPERIALEWWHDDQGNQLTRD